MGYRDNLNAALARTSSLDRELALAKAEILALREALTAADPSTFFNSLPEVEARDFAVSNDDRILADKLISKALLHDPPAHSWENGPSPQPPSFSESLRDAAFDEGRELGRREGAVAAYRFALKQLLEKRIGYISPALEDRVRSCTDTGQLVTWLVLAGSLPDCDIESALGLT